MKTPGDGALYCSGKTKYTQQKIEREQGPSKAIQLDAPQDSITHSQWHAHQKTQVNGQHPALNLDGSSRDGTPTFSNKTLKWLKSFGWKI